MFSILVKDDEKLSVKVPYALISDLNIDRIIRLVTAGLGDDVKKLYDLFPADAEEAEYRREIFADIKKEGAAEIFSCFQDILDEWADCKEKKEKFDISLQQCVWYIREVHAYLAAVELLKEKLPPMGFESEGMKQLMAFLDEYTGTEEYKSYKETVYALYDELVGFRVKITYTRDKFVVTEGSGKGAYQEALGEHFNCKDATFRNPYLNGVETSDIEYETAKMLMKKNKAFAEWAEAFLLNAKDYVREEILLLKKEVTYYTAYYRFMERMQKQGLRFTAGRTEGDKFSVNGLYDLALACAYSESGNNVVPNDAELKEGESFFVVTGPNQGGKTTFARSLGQLVFFYKMGLDVPATKATLPFFGTLLTHFSVEESNATGRGKLVDELERLKPIMEKREHNAFIVINELFTTAAHLDACVMGEKVLKYLIGEGARGAYVTHLNELSEADGAVVSLTAELDENLNRTFKIARKAAREYVGTNALTVKYGLTYEQIKERLA
ncbi:MAG: hypothetical protein K5679_11710 [Lachnospiraceae bacterium]|nr:hypothetical protein [Lachnospiraceae bacterium]